MSAIERIATSLLAGQVDAMLSALASAGTATTAQACVPAPATTGGATLPGAVSPDTGSTASAQAELSNVALMLDALSRYGGDASPPVQGRMPLLSASPRDVAPSAAPAAEPVGATPASAPPSPVGSLALSASGTAGDGASVTHDALLAARVLTLSGATATSAADALSAALGQALAQALTESGLFYESHLAQWLSGKRSAVSLAREPQAQRDFGRSPLAAPPFDASNTRAASQRAPGESPMTGATYPWGLLNRLDTRGLPDPGAPGSAAAGESTSDDAPHPGDAPQGAPNPAALASVLAKPSPTYEFPRARDRGRTLALTNLAAGAERGATSMPADAPPGIHPDVAILVRQQLDLLNSSQFHWSGQAWPGTRLDWRVEPPNPHEQATGAFGGARAWRTSVTLSLPSLGMIGAELTLQGTQLQVRVVADTASVTTLRDAVGSLHERLETAGLDVSGLAIRDAASASASASHDTAMTLTEDRK